MNRELYAHNFVIATMARELVLLKGVPAEGFAGCYQIRYFDEKGHVQAERELVIQKDNEYYLLSWIHNGRLSGEGIGLETAEGLTVGYHDVKTF
jgi:hypothetical protein